MSKKLLTDDLILSKMAEDHSAVPAEDIDTEDKYRKIQEHYDFSIDSNWNGRYDMQFYTETTADGYEIWLATENESSPYISEDVYYYDHDVADAIREQIRYGDTTFYIDSCVYEDCYIDDMLLNIFADYAEEIISDAESGESETNITLKELQILKEEYDLEEETADVT